MDLAYFVVHEIRLRGTLNYTPAEFEEAVQWMAEKRFDPNLLVTHVHPLAEGAEVFEELAQKRENGIKIVLAAPEVAL